MGKGYEDRRKSHLQKSVNDLPSNSLHTEIVHVMIVRSLYVSMHTPAYRSIHIDRYNKYPFSVLSFISQKYVI